jgi:hypothetical protein
LRSSVRSRQAPPTFAPSELRLAGQCPENRRSKITESSVPSFVSTSKSKRMYDAVRHREESKPSDRKSYPRLASRFSAHLPTRRMRGRHSHQWMVCEASWSFLKRNQRSRSPVQSNEQSFEVKTSAEGWVSMMRAIKCLKGIWWMPWR